MPNEIVTELIRAVAKLQSDVQWLKRYHWVSWSTSGAILLVLLKLVLK